MEIHTIGIDLVWSAAVLQARGVSDQRFRTTTGSLSTVYPAGI
jgi:hypothetical protein